ncbi:MAG: sulfatase-like hydrolase/transferase [Chrysiogenetes bacterium]|nr:sulfatase-like hydrolase/transferase [Chrysiogenetes bacterium]
MSAQARRALICLSLGNLWFLPVWAELLPSAIGGRNLYYFAALPPRIHYWLLPISVVLLAAIFFGVSSALKRSAFTEAVFLLLLVIPLNGIRIQIDALALGSLVRVFGKAGLLGAGLAGLALGVWLLLKRRESLVRAVLGALTMAAAFVPVTFGQSLWNAATWEAPHDPSGYLVKDADAPAPSRRMLWLLFDEADYELIFEHRSPNISLPAIDALAARAVQLTNAAAPGPATAYSIPAYTSGREVLSAMPVARDRMLLQFAGAEDYVPWSQVPTLFEMLHDQGARVGVEGWHHPYCRQFAAQLSYCRDHLSPPLLDGRGMGAWEMQWQRLLQSFPLVYRLGGGILEDSRLRKTELESIHEGALALAADPSIDFVWVHYPVPHLPGIWDAGADRYVLDRQGSYEDNLELMDRALGEVLATLDRSDLAGITDVIVTSDHQFRTKKNDDRRVPLLIRFAGEERGARFDGALNARVAHDLVLERFAGKITDVSSLLDWLGERADYSGR